MPLESESFVSDSSGSKKLIVLEETVHRADGHDPEFSDRERILGRNGAHPLDKSGFVGAEAIEGILALNVLLKRRKRKKKSG